MNPLDDVSELEPWQWPEEIWRGYVEKVRAGRRLVADEPAARWPEGARCAVLISFDSDHETPALRDRETSPGMMAQGEYGSRVAVPRLLRLLRDYEVTASFYMPAVSALLHPGEVPSYVEQGHEIAVHGWIHERNAHLGYEQELDLLGRAVEVLEQQSGSRPVGIRTPSWDFSDSTLQVIQELGFRYDSSLMADDEPYELVAAGVPTGIVEIPVEWIRDDAPYFNMARFKGLRPQLSPRDVEQIFIDEFDGAYTEGGAFTLTLHPHVSGHRSRIGVLARLLDHIRTHDDVWIGTHAHLAEHVRPLLAEEDTA